MVSYVVTLWLLLTFNFALPRAMPGDPISAMLAGVSRTSAPGGEERDALERYYGLDRSLPTQYRNYLVGLGRGDLGRSIKHHRPVVDVLADALPWTLLLGLAAVAVATTAGVVAGVQSGWRRGRAADRAMLGASILLRGIPVFFLASMALFVFSVKLGWFPLFGATTAFAEPTLLGGVVDIAHHLALPVATSALLFSTGPYLLMRAGMVGELGADHLLLGRAKGVRERRLKYRYAARNALLPVVSFTAVELGLVLSGGLIFVETVFAYPGIGRLMFEAVNARDYPLLQGGFLVLTTMVLSLNFVAEALYARLDPRTRT